MQNIHQFMTKRVINFQFSVVWLMGLFLFGYSQYLYADDHNGSSLDLVLVLDNSGSMKNNDPDFLVKQAAKKFINDQNFNTQVSIIIFDQRVHLAIPFIYAIEENNDSFDQSLDLINYLGKFTDSPAAVERAIYELKNYARENSQKAVVFLTDGIVDTGNETQDLEKTRWLKQELAADARENNIRIYAIGFTENADFQLIQSLSQQTDAEYFRALTATELESAFGNINKLIEKNLSFIQQDNREQAVEEITVTDTAELPIVESNAIEGVTPEPISETTEDSNIKIESVNVVPEPDFDPSIEVAEDIKPLYPEDSKSDLQQWMPYLLPGLFFIILFGLVYLFYMKSKWNVKGDEFYISEAYLVDVHGHTKEKKYRLGQSATMIGRVESSDNEQLNYITIPESTIGRRHALIEYKDFAFWVIDQGSTNGTFVNDRLIDQETRLKDGDRVRFHKFEFVFEVPELQEDGVTEVSATVLKQAVAARAKELPEPQFDITVGKQDANKTRKDSKIKNEIIDITDDYFPDSEDVTILPDQVQESTKDDTLEPLEFDKTTDK